MDKNVCHHTKNSLVGSLTFCPKTAYMMSGKYHLHNALEAEKSIRGTPAPVGSTWENLSSYCRITGVTCSAHSLIAREISIVRSFPSPLFPPRSIGTAFLSPTTTSSGKYCEPTLIFQFSTQSLDGNRLCNARIMSSRLVFSEDVKPSDDPEMERT